MIKLATRIVTAYVANNAVPASDLPVLIDTIHRALTEMGQTPAEPVQPAPAVSVRKSITADRIVCLDCGKPMKMLRRHLAQDHGLTPDEYRAKWGLPADYPLVAPNYAARRSELAKKAGLGTKRKGAEPPAAPPAEEPAQAGFRYPANRWAKPTGE